MNNWDRVIAAVVIRRSELGLTQKELAARAGVAERTVQNLEAGTRPQPLIRGKIEQALGWPVGEMDRIASKQDAEPEPKPELDDDQELLETLRRVYRDDPDGPEKIRTVLRAVAAHEASGQPRSA